MGDRRKSDLNLLHLQRISNFNVHQKVPPKDIYEICLVRRLTVAESKRTIVCKKLNT